MALREGTSGRIVLVAAIVAIAALMRPFPTRSDAEATWGTLRLADTAAQIERGVFPVYVGQSDAIPDGTPYAGAPVRPAIGAAIHFLTLGKYPPASIERLVGLLCALGGVWAAYYGLRTVLRDHRRVRFLLAVTYAVGGLALWQSGKCSETALVAVPLVPLLFSELVRGARRPDFRAAGSCAALLALLWMAHPPTGLTATVVAVIGVGSWSSTRGRLWATGLFVLLSAWFFACAVPLGVFPVRVSWLSDQCALLAAVGCTIAALVLRRLMASDRWELALEMEQPSGAPEALLTLRPLTALGVLAIFGAAVAGVIAGRAPGAATARPEPASLLPVSASAAFRERNPIHTFDPILNNHLQTAGSDSANGAVVPFTPAPGDATPQPERPAPGYVPVHSREGMPILHFVIQPGKRYSLTLEYWTKSYRGSLRVAGGAVPQQIPLPADSDGVRALRLPLVCRSSEPETIEVSLAGVNTSAEPGSGVYCGSVGLVAYRPEELPVRVSSVAPYAASVQVSGDDGFLVTRCRFVPGYAAQVNGQNAPVFRSADGFVAVRVPPGASEVRLRYRGTLAMRVGFWVSALSAFGLAVAAVGRAVRRLRPAKAPTLTPDRAIDVVPMSRAA